MEVQSLGQSPYSKKLTGSPPGLFVWSRQLHDCLPFWRFLELSLWQKHTHAILTYSVAFRMLLSQCTLTLSQNIVHWKFMQILVGLLSTSLSLTPSNNFSPLSAAGRHGLFGVGPGTDSLCYFVKACRVILANQCSFCRWSTYSAQY